MLIKWGSIVVDGSGKLGGHIFSKSRGGNTIRTLARATNPQTIYQQLIRSRFTQLSQGWRDLTESERESWYQAESSFSRTNRFGDVVLLTGKNLYNSLNAQRAVIGLEVLDVAPMPDKLLINRNLDSRFGISTRTLVVKGEFASNTKYVIVATKGMSQGVRFANNNFRIIDTQISNSTGTRLGSGEQVYSKYIDQFGVPTGNDKIFVGSYYINESGQKSIISSLQARYL